MSYMLCHQTLYRHKKCSCGYTCPYPDKESTKLDRDEKKKEPSEAVKKVLDIKEE